MSAEDEVRAAAAALVGAFASGDADAYFACFAEDATFVFHTTPERLESRAAYRAVWDTWVAEDGFEVLGCVSSNALVRVAGDVAWLAHDVATRIRTTAGEEALSERETIVFERRDGRWVAVHEHLSPRPADAASGA